LELTFDKLNYIGLQCIEYDEETKLTYIDETVHHIPLNSDIVKTLNTLYLNKNALYVEFISQVLKYKKITDKKVSCILINPHSLADTNKQLVEFTNRYDNFPYNFSNINIQDYNSYDVKLIIKHAGVEIYNNNISVQMGISYSIPFGVGDLQCDKKPNSLKITVINLTNESNIQLGNINATTR